MLRAELSVGQRIERRTSYRWTLLSVPTSVFLVLLIVVPIIVTLGFSLVGFVDAGVTDGQFTLANYISVLTDPFYLEIFGRTLLLGVASMLLALILGFPVAMILVRGRGFIPQLLTLLVLTPMMTSIVVRSYAWNVIYSDTGIIIQTINEIGRFFGAPPISLQFTYAGTAIALAHILLPLMVFSLAGALRQIDPDVVHAARSLGAGRVRSFFDTILPLAAPGVFAGCLLVFVLAISSFPTPQLVGGASTQVVATLIYSRSTIALNWPLSSAMSMCLLVLVFLLMFISRKGSIASKEKIS